MNERAILLGRAKTLVGIISEPTQTDSAKSDLAVIVLNAGLVHRVGPNRINVQIARRLASSGFTALRFDLAGIGDSPNRTDDLSLKDGIINDVKDIMDSLNRENGARRFILIGICSGANNSLRIADSDNRVVGAVPIEPYHFSTPAYHFYYFSRRLLDLRCWRRAISMKSDFWSILAKKFRHENVPGANRRSSVADRVDRQAFRNQISSEIERLAGRGVSLHFVYCIDSPSYFNHYLPLRRRAASLPQFQVSLFEDTDHTFTSVASQQSLVEAIDKWVSGLVKTPSFRRRLKESASSAAPATLP
jgi:dienelactone hydrolase